MFAPTKVWRKWHQKINLNQKSVPRLDYLLLLFCVHLSLPILGALQLPPPSPPPRSPPSSLPAATTFPPSPKSPSSSPPPPSPTPKSPKPLPLSLSSRLSAPGPMSPRYAQAANSAPARENSVAVVTASVAVRLSFTTPMKTARSSCARSAIFLVLRQAACLQ